MIMIIFAVGAGIFTAVGLHFYSLVVGRIRNPILRVMLFSFFVTLFIGGPLYGCAMMSILCSSNEARSVQTDWAFFMLLSWIGTLWIYIVLNQVMLKRCFNIPIQERQRENSRTWNADATSIHPDFSSLGRVPELDGLRGFAVLFVIIYHGTRYLSGGFIGVDMFFVLSGFLITVLLVEEFSRSNSINFKNFYRRRGFRLVPALAAMLMTYCFLNFIVLNMGCGWESCVDAIIAFAYLTNWSQAFSIHPSIYLRHTWSLSVEEQFYIIWPFILLILLRLSNRRRHILLVASAFALMSWLLRIYLCANGSFLESLYVRLDARADSLMIGCALGIILFPGWINEKIKPTLQSFLVILAPLSLTGLFALSFVANFRKPVTYYFGFVLVAFLTAVLIADVLVSRQSVVRKVLGMKWLVWVGSISYGLYLWHFVVFLALNGLNFNSLAVFIVGTLLSFLVATTSYYTMERPILRLKKPCPSTTQEFC
jgi:peptidoglycan/LPS O-acetylase OafA/YrhL